MRKKTLFRQQVLDRFQGPFEADSAFTVVSARRRLAAIALGLLIAAAVCVVNAF